MSAGAGSRRGIAHSSRVLGTDKKTRDTIALSQLTNGKVDVSFEGVEGSSSSPSLSKGKSRAQEDHEGENGQTALFDVDLEAGQQADAGASASPRAGRLLRLGSSMPWKKVRIDPTPAYEATSTHLGDRGNDSLDFARTAKGAVGHKAGHSADTEDDDFRRQLGAFGDDDEQLLYAGADHADDSDPFPSGAFDYAALQDDTQEVRYSSAAGFEAVTWLEGAWMSVSSVVVAALMTVAILISIDVIDWPGDGLGNN